MRILLYAVALVLVTSCEVLPLDHFEPREVKWFNGIQDNNFDTLVDKFVEVAHENGVDLEYIYNHEINIGLVANYEWAGTAHARDNNELIHITINEEVYNQMAPLSRWTLLFHELGHDVLNYAHRGGHSIDSLELMHQAKNRNIRNADELKAALDMMFTHYKINLN